MFSIFKRKNHYICTAYIFVVLYFLSLIPAQFEVLDPVGKALSDFQLTDLVFSELREKQKPDTNIVLVNIAQFNRAQIAKQLNIINSFKPKVIGLDAFFFHKKNFKEDVPLMMALSETKNLVMVTDLVAPDKTGLCFDSAITSHTQFHRFGTSGFADMRTSHEGFRTVRDFVPKFCLNDTTAYSFAAQIVSIFDPEAFQQLVKRDRVEETINWKGNYTHFFSIEADDLLEKNIDFSFLKDKIVLMGYLGNNRVGEPTLEDAFFTPLNAIPAGRSFPDMQGVTIHANIISQIIGRRYIETTPIWLNAIIAIVLVFLNVSLFMWVGEFYKVYYDLITKLLILVEVSLLFSLNLVSLLYFDLKVDLTVAIIAIIFSGDLTELYVGSLKDIGLMMLKKIKTLIEKKPTT